MGTEDIDNVRLNPTLKPKEPTLTDSKEDAILPDSIEDLEKAYPLGKEENAKENFKVLGETQHGFVPISEEDVDYYNREKTTSKTFKTWNINGTDYVTVTQFHEITEVSRNRIRELINKGNAIRQLKCMRIEGKIFIPAAEITNFPFTLQGNSSMRYKLKIDGLTDMEIDGEGEEPREEESQEEQTSKEEDNG